MAFRMPYNDSHRVTVHGIMARPRGVVVHFVAGADKHPAPPWPSIENYLYWLSQKLYGYHRIVFPTVIYETADLDALVWHSGRYNADFFGLALSYPGPHLSRPQDSEGWVQGPWTDPTSKKVRSAWYPPYDAGVMELAERECAKLLAFHCRPGAKLVKHSDISSHNDPGTALPEAWFDRVRARVLALLPASVVA